MAGANDAALVVAVSEAGALGSLPCAMLSVDRMRVELGRIRQQMDRSFSMNFFCHEPPDAGASGVQIGSALLGCPESTISDSHRSALHVATDADTALTNVFSGRPARGVMNCVMREVGPMVADAPPFPTAGVALAPLKAAAETDGKDDFTSLWSGQGARLFREMRAKALVRVLVEEAAQRFVALRRED